MNLDWVCIYNTVVMERSFTKAATKLGISKVEASRAVRKLEQNFQTKLIERTTRSIKVTEAGRIVFDRYTKLLDEASQISEEVKGIRNEISGEIRIAAPLELGTWLCKNWVPGLAKNYPKLKISFVLSYSYSDLIAEGIDLAIRIGQASDQSLITFKLGHLQRGIFASDSYLKKAGRLNHPSDLIGLNFLNFRDSALMPIEQTFYSGKQEVTIQCDGNINVENFNALAELCAAGLGVAYLPSNLFSEFIKKNRLKAVLPNWTMKNAEVSAVYPSKDFKTRKLVVVLDSLKEFMNAAV